MYGREPKTMIINQQQQQQQQNTTNDNNDNNHIKNAIKRNPEIKKNTEINSGIFCLE